MRYILRLDFCDEGDPPSVEVYDCKEGTNVLGVFEEPTHITGGFSWNDDDWTPGPLAERVLRLLNGEES